MGVAVKKLPHLCFIFVWFVFSFCVFIYIAIYFRFNGLYLHFLTIIP